MSFLEECQKSNLAKHIKIRKIEEIITDNEKYPKAHNKVTAIRLILFGDEL